MDLYKSPVILLIVTVSVVFSAKANYAGGSGTPDDPYRIYDPAGLEQMELDKCYILVSDINLYGRSYDDCIVASDVIGDYGYPEAVYYDGVFDGNGFVIKNSRAPIFGSLSGTVKNLRIENCNIDGYLLRGAIAERNGGVIVDCSVSGSIQSLHGEVGLIAGRNYGTIEKCYSTGSVLVYNNIGGGDIAASIYCGGGLVGFNKGDIANCFSAANVQNNTTAYYNYGFYSYSGGLVGYMERGGVDKCYSIGEANRSGTQYISGQKGGLIGERDGGSVTNSFWDVLTSGLSTSSGGSGRLTYQMTLQSTYTAADWDFLGSSSDGTEDIWYKTISYPVPNGIYLAGDGSLSLPYQVWNASQLCTVLSGSAYLDKKIKLNADISMADVVYPRPAASAATPFTGTFDGSKKIISSLSITSNYDNSSLFGVIGSGGLVKDIGLKNAAISSPGGSYAGGIAGRCDGSIMSCFVTGSIEGESFAGSLAGSLGGLATVSNCYSICDVTVTGQTAGGIAAEISDYASVSGCYAAGGCYGTLAGGIAAAADMTADVDASFYNSDKTIWSIAGTGKNRQEMGESQTYINASWPMGAMWYMLEGGLPLFDWQSLRFDADLNGDSTVDLLDVAAIANDWKQPTYQAKSDIYPDMEINTADVCILAQQWLTGK